MRDLSFYQRESEPKAKARTATLKEIQSPWYSEAWKNLTGAYAQYPFSSESHLTFRFEEKSIRTIIEEVRSKQLRSFMPAAMRDALGPIKKEGRLDYGNPKPYEEINVRISIFGSRHPSAVPEKFALVIYFFSAKGGSPIASYTEEVHCVFH